MPQNTEPIQIKEPAIEELKKGRSCAKRSCTTGCGCIVIFLIASLVLLRYVFAPKINETKKIPENFPKNITIYDADSIYRITYIFQKEQNKTLETLAYVPKVILAPLIIIADQYHLNEAEDNLTGMDLINSMRQRKSISWNDFAKIINKPLTGRRDVIQIEWQNMPAAPNFISKYYQNELTKAGYTISAITNEKGNSYFSFKQEQNDGTLFIKDDLQKNGTDYVALTVNLDSK